MNKVSRMLAIAGMALAAGATIGATPAMASSSTTQQGTTIAAQSQSGDRIVGYYRSLGQCERAGRFGEWTNRWDDHDCYRLRHGFRHGWWVLSVDWGWNNGHHGNNNHGWGNNNHGWGDNNHHGGGNNHHGGGNNHHGGGNNHHGDGNNHHGDGNNHGGNNNKHDN